MKAVHKLIVLLACIVLADTALAAHQNNRTYRPPVKREFVEMLLLLKGLKNTYPCQIPATDQGTTSATCVDFDVIDLKTNRIVGTATDTTADVAPEGTGLVATGTTFFRFPQGTLVVRGRGSIQPTLVGPAILNRAQITHIAGIFPPSADANAVLSGTGRYRNATGSLVLLGALNLDNAPVQEQFFCLFLLRLNLNHDSAYAE
ncbi:MAG: hypothetical protein M3Z21_15850 [Pseudomonadota bacterium]|nr:hypothetical protein [Pseudomonadota bacterium]